jgi:hypothetical protein
MTNKMPAMMAHLPEDEEIVQSARKLGMDVEVLRIVRAIGDVITAQHATSPQIIAALQDVLAGRLELQELEETLARPPSSWH